MVATIALKVLDERIRPYLPAYATSGSSAMEARACILSTLANRGSGVEHWRRKVTLLDDTRTHSLQKTGKLALTRRLVAQFAARWPKR